MIKKGHNQSDSKRIMMLITSKVQTHYKCEWLEKSKSRIDRQIGFSLKINAAKLPSNENNQLSTSD